MTFKSIMNFIAGEIFANGGPDMLTQQLQFGIIMMTANPFFN